MFYQDNDYMRDSYFCGNSGNNTLYGNMQNPYSQNNYQMPMGQNFPNQPLNLNNMYPQIYKIISPVANRVITTSNLQYMTEDSLNNMVDTVYNIVEGDVSSLVNTENSQAQITEQSTNSSNNSRSQSMSSGSTTNTSSNDRRSSNNSTDFQDSSGKILRDLIKIIIIKELLSRQNGNNYYNLPQNQGTLPMSYYNPYGYGMM